MQQQSRLFLFFFPPSFISSLERRTDCAMTAACSSISVEYSEVVNYLRRWLVRGDDSFPHRSSFFAFPLCFSCQKIAFTTSPALRLKEKNDFNLFFYFLLPVVCLDSLFSVYRRKKTRAGFRSLCKSIRCRKAQCPVREPGVDRFRQRSFCFLRSNVFRRKRFEISLHKSTLTLKSAVPPMPGH